MKYEDVSIISKPPAGVSEVPGTEVTDYLLLKQRQITAVGKVTCMRNNLEKLMLGAENLDESKIQLTNYDQLFVIYQRALYDV